MGSLYEVLPPDEARRIINRIEVVHTPKHGIWLNMAEFELNALNRQCLVRRIPDKATLINETTAWQDARNCKEANIDWQFITEESAPIASGIIEGACRHIVKDRLARSNMRWSTSGAQSMLSLKSLRAS